MNAQELETAVRHGINVVTVVMNNNCWGSEKAYQKHFYGGRYIGCDIGNPRYDQYARLFGAEGYYVEHPGRGRAPGGALLRQAGGRRNPDRPGGVPNPRDGCAPPVRIDLRAPQGAGASASTAAAAFSTTVPLKNPGLRAPHNRTALAKVKSRKSSALMSPSSSSS